jgi:hypothetical protein
MQRDIDVYLLSEDELVDLNRRVVERLQMIRQARRYQQMLTFSAGERVSFVDDRGRVNVGRVIRFNHKTVSIDGEDGRQWRVAPSLLSKVIDGKEAQADGQLLSGRVANTVD